MELEQRIEKGVELFKSGYNCSQSVFAAFADIYGYKFEDALRISASFGGGIGRMRETCGAACGLFMLASLENGSVDPKDRAAKAANYKLVQDFAAKFVEANGMLKCSALIKEEKSDSAVPSERTAEYYKKRPCTQIVENACRIFAEYKSKQQEESN